jgi:hypothetical protein
MKKMTTTTMRTMMAMMLGVAILGASESSAAPLVFFGDDGGNYTTSPSWPSGSFNPYDESTWPSLPDAPPSGGNYVNCSERPFDCLDSNVVLDLAPLLQQGNNNLLFRVTEGNRSSLGLNSFDEVNQVPEPASMILIGTGLIGIAARARKRYPAPRA